MPTFGIVMRAKPILFVLRGFDPNQPYSKTQAYPVRADQVDTLKSGMVISANPVDGGGPEDFEWEIGWEAGRIPFTALQDGNAFDVKSAKSLVGYSCLGDFVLQTGYFDSGASYTQGTPLTPDGTTGNVTATTADSGEPIMGYASGPVVDLLSGGATGYPKISGVTDGNVLVYQTAWVPNPSLA